MDIPSFLSHDGIRRATVLQAFKDHKGAAALSATFPVSDELREKYSSNPTNPGILETDLGYPCLQVYVTTRTPFLENSQSIGRAQTENAVYTILEDLVETDFFRSFEGIRFEVYDGRREFRHQTQPTLSDVRGMSNHAMEERDDRNALINFRAAFTKYGMHKDVCETMQRQGADVLEYEKQTRHLYHAQEELYKAGAPLSSTIAEASRNTEQAISEDLQVMRLGYPGGSINERAFVPVQPALNSGDAGNLHMLRSLILHNFSSAKAYARYPIGETEHHLMNRFHAPITPNSFYNPAGQPFHLLVIFMLNPNVAANLYVLRSEKEFEFDQMIGKQMQLQEGPHFKLLPVTVRDGPTPGHKLNHIGVVLREYLHRAGVGVPVPTSKTTQANTQAISTWFSSQ